MIASSSTPSPAPSAVPSGPPSGLSPDQLVEWSQSEAGQAFIASLGMKLMEERVNAEQAGKAAPVVVDVERASL